MKRQRNSRQRGIALLITMIALVVLTILGLGLTTTGRISRMISDNHGEAIEANNIAEEGLTHARELIAAYASSPASVLYTSILQMGDGTGCTADELSTAVTDPIPSNGYAFGGGSYVVSICDDADGDNDTNADSNSSVLVVSVGTGSDGATATVEFMLGFSDLPAVLVDGSLRINSATKVMGAGGMVHSNGNLHLNGSDACAQLHFTTSGTIYDPPAQGNTGAACNESGGGMDVRPGEDEITIPTVDFNNLKNNVDFILKDNGKIYIVALASEVNPFGGWAWSDPKWEIDGPVTGSYYAENTAITINNISGTASFVADGYIQVSGNPGNLSPDLTLDGVSYSMVAGYDLKLNGNAVTTIIEGVFFANHQVDISGNPNISGQVIAADVADTDCPPDGNNLIQLSSGWMEFSGNPTITYSGGFGFGDSLISGWREIRN